MPRSALPTSQISWRTTVARHSLEDTSVVPDIACIGIDHGEEDANALPVLLHRPIRGRARRESVALVRPAQSVVEGAALSPRIPANGEPFAIDVEGEQHRPGPSLCSAVHSWNGRTVAVTAGIPVHENQHPWTPTLTSIAYMRSADALCRSRYFRLHGRGDARAVSGHEDLHRLAGRLVPFSGVVH